MPATTPVGDSVPKVNNEFAVGDSLDFQRQWWRFEKAVWIIFSLVVIADLLGCFGRGPVANAEMRSPDGATDIKYQRIERFSTPSILTVNFGSNAVHDGQIKLWVSNSLLKPLGNQRVIPQPLASVLDDGGVLYTFASSAAPNPVEFALEPATFGVFPLSLRVPGSAQTDLKIYVMP